MIKDIDYLMSYTGKYFQLPPILLQLQNEGNPLGSFMYSRQLCPQGSFPTTSQLGSFIHVVRLRIDEQFTYIRLK